MIRMKNYRDLSSTAGDVGAGFQFEFYCQCCDFTWRSPFKAHRMGQLTGWLTRLTFLMTDLNKAGKATSAMSTAGARGAHEEAFEAAQAQAQRYFNQCTECRNQACDECWDDSLSQCKTCLNKHKRPGGASAGHGGGYDEGQGGAGGLACPNCQVPSSGGRFCHECGFDMASTHKSCPGCGGVMPRAARFCTDCGHGF
ncbi:hypothetical protein EIP75_00605 [Aquabacterium soli]|jgi:hypothetical protein|uniref:DZANK-type domain-containing protein n=2 Tax=Aquabacterium soli TaxID=2493092 RepID=A0A3R8TW70_9BURK|nr:hypothetical protein EIP75_00605 [Aquabacterium soli]